MQNAKNKYKPTSTRTRTHELVTRFPYSFPTRFSDSLGSAAPATPSATHHLSRVSFHFSGCSSTVLSLPGAQAPPLDSVRTKSFLSPGESLLPCFVPETLIFETPLPSGETASLTPECFMWPRSRCSHHNASVLLGSGPSFPENFAGCLSKLPKCSIP